MKRSLVILLVFILACGFLSNAGMKRMIRWKKLDTKAAVTAEIDRYIHTGNDINSNYRFLENEHHSFIQMNSDTSICFHSPEIAVHFGAWVTRKWMFNFHYENKQLTSYDVEEGLTGP